MTDERQLIIREDILKALAHPEAEEGLYLENLQIVHEDEEREPVRGDQDEILDELAFLIREGKVVADESNEKVAFRLKSESKLSAFVAAF